MINRIKTAIFEITLLFTLYSIAYSLGDSSAVLFFLVFFACFLISVDLIFGKKS